MQLPYWAEVDKFVNHVAKIYVSYRTLSPEEEAKTNVYTITKDVSDEKPKLRFETAIPGFFNVVNLPIVIHGFGLPEEPAPSRDTTQKAIDSKSDDEFKLLLPGIKIVGKTGDDTSQIPATSSSMMRYFIKKIIREKRDNKNAEILDQILDQYKQKIKNTMFGPTLVPENWEQLFLNTIADYENPKNYEKIFPEEAKDIEYEKQYNAIFPAAPAAVDVAAVDAAVDVAAPPPPPPPGGGARSKKTKRRNGRRNSRSKTRKRRLTNKRRGNRRRNRTHH